MAENKNSNRGVYNPSRFSYTDAKVSKKLKEKEEPDTGIFTTGEKRYNQLPTWIGLGLIIGVTSVAAGFCCLSFNFTHSTGWGIGGLVAIILTGLSWAATNLVSMIYHRQYSARNVSKSIAFLRYALPYFTLGMVLTLFFVIPMRYTAFSKFAQNEGFWAGLWYLFLILIWVALAAGILHHVMKKETVAKVYDWVWLVLGLWIPVCFYHILRRSGYLGKDAMYIVIFAPIVMLIACIFRQQAQKKRYWIHAYEMTANLAVSMELIAFITYPLWLNASSTIA